MCVSFNRKNYIINKKKDGVRNMSDKVGKQR